MRTIYSLIASMLIIGNAYTQDSTLSVATFNCYFLFDGVEPEYRSNFYRKGNPEMAKAHLKDVAAEIRSINADIVNLVEVENESVLQSLVEELSDLEYQYYFVQGTDTYTGQNVALLSKYVPEGKKIQRYSKISRSFRNDESYSVSKNYYAQFNIHGVDIAIIGTHLMAFLDDENRLHQRRAQAGIISDLSDSLSELGYKTIVLGDFNDYDTELMDAGSSVSISKALILLKYFSNGLFNPLSFLNQEERYTSVYDKNKNGQIEEEEKHAIDHILVDRSLYYCIDSVSVPKRYELGKESISDHYPVVVTLNLSSNNPIISRSSTGIELNEALTYAEIAQGFEYQSDTIISIMKARKDLKRGTEVRSQSLESFELNFEQYLQNRDRHFKHNKEVFVFDERHVLSELDCFYAVNNFPTNNITLPDNKWIMAITEFRALNYGRSTLGDPKSPCQYDKFVRDRCYARLKEISNVSHTQFVIGVRLMGRPWKSSKWYQFPVKHFKYEIVTVVRVNESMVKIRVYYIDMLNNQWPISFEPRDSGKNCREIIRKFENLECHE